MSKQTKNIFFCDARKISACGIFLAMFCIKIVPTASVVWNNVPLLPMFDKQF
jgi:hypothetical protein